MRSATPPRLSRPTCAVRHRPRPSRSLGRLAFRCRVQPQSAQLVVHHQSCPASRINAITCSGSADHASPAAMALPARLPAEPRSGRNQGLNHVVAILLGNEYHLQLGVPSGSNLVPEHALARCGSFFVASERVVRGHLATGVPNLDGLASTSGAAILKPKSSNPLPRRMALKATEAKRRRCDAGVRRKRGANPLGRLRWSRAPDGASAPGHLSRS